MKDKKVSLDEEVITKKLKHRIEISRDQEKIFLTVDYMDGRFIVEKNFSNNYFGLEECSKMREKLSTEDKVSKYLGLGETNE